MTTATKFPVTSTCGECSALSVFDRDAGVFVPALGDPEAHGPKCLARIKPGCGFYVAWTNLR